MNLADISNIYQENLNSFFRNKKVIELIYKEQFGSDNYQENADLYQKKYNDIMDNTVFVPYITLQDLDNFLINSQMNYIDKANPNKKAHLLQQILQKKQNIIKEYSSLLLDDLKTLFPNLTEDEYSNILKHCSNKSFGENSKFIEDALFTNKKGLFIKFKKSKVEKIIKNYEKNANKKISVETEKCFRNYRQLYGSNYLESHFSKELNLSKKLNAEKKDIIKKYSSFMLDDLKELFPSLTNNEYSKILKHCSNTTFDENAKFIEDELFKNKKGLFTKLKKNKVEKIIKKYKKLADEKVLMETSSFYKHLSDVPKGKYYTDILEGISSGGQFVSAKIGKKTEKNIRYIFLPVFNYKTKEEYLKNALHEVMHISKEQLSTKHYKSGFIVRTLPNNPLASDLTVNKYPFASLGQTIRWSKIAKKNNIPKHSGLYKIINGTAATEEVLHHWQTREVLFKIVHSGLIKSLNLKYRNKSNANLTYHYELFDDTTIKFVGNFKRDIQNINNGILPIKQFKRKIGKSNFSLFAQTAHFCVKPITSPTSGFTNMTLNVTNGESSNKDIYNELGINIVEKMKATSTKMEIQRAAKIEKRTKRQAFIEKTKDKIASMNILNIGKSIESKMQNKQKDISNGLTR